MMLPREAIADRLAAVGYIADRDIATALWLMEFLKRPLLLEGEAGVGKTEVAKALAAVHGGERLGHLGLTDASLAFEQQRTLQELHQPQRGRDVAVGNVADGGEAISDGFARQHHGAEYRPLLCDPPSARTRGP